MTQQHSYQYQRRLTNEELVFLSSHASRQQLVYIPLFFFIGMFFGTGIGAIFHHITDGERPGLTILLFAVGSMVGFFVGAHMSEIRVSRMENKLLAPPIESNTIVITPPSEAEGGQESEREGPHGLRREDGSYCRAGVYWGFSGDEYARLRAIPNGHQIRRAYLEHTLRWPGLHNYQQNEYGDNKTVYEWIIQELKHREWIDNNNCWLMEGRMGSQQS